MLFKNEILATTIMLLLFTSIKAQLSIQFNSLIKDTNIVYIGIDNDLEFSGIPNFKIQAASMPNTSITLKDNFNLYLSPKRPGWDTLKIQDQKGEWYSFPLQICFIGEPKIQLGYSKQSANSVARILGNPRLYISLNDCYYRHGAHISSFAFTTDTLDRHQPLRRTTGYHFNARMIEDIKKLKAGDYFVISEAKMRGRDSRTRNLPKQVFTIL